MLEIKKFIVSIMNTNCYLVTDNELGFIVDPGESCRELDIAISSIKKIEYILLTHGHFDHISAATRYKELTGAKIVLGIEENEFTKNSALNLSEKFNQNRISAFDADILVKDADALSFANSYIKTIHTPGHTKGGVCYLIDNSIFTGDTIMNGTVGRCDFPTGNKTDLELSINKLLKLKGDCVVYPGHGPATTINNERQEF